MYQNILENMRKMYKLFVCLLFIVYTIQPISAIQRKNFIYGQYDYNETVSVSINNFTEQILDFNEATDAWDPTRVYVSTNETITSDMPIFITAMQQKGISSWELPLVVQSDKKTMYFTNMARTLCPHDAGPDTKPKNRPTIHVATDNDRNTSVEITLRRVTDFYVEINHEISVSVSPSSPQYFFFSFEQNPWNVTGHRLRGLPVFNYTIPKSVILKVEADDVLCAMVSIQNNSCPVFDTEKDLRYQGYYFTMMDLGGITLTQSMFPHGFYIVFVVKETDEECTGVSETAILTDQTPGDERMKHFRFRVVATISYKEYAVGAAAVVAVVALVVALVALAALACRPVLADESLVEEEPGPSSSDAVGETTDTAPVLDNEEEPWSAALTVGRLSRAPPDSLARRSHRYFWGALTVAVVYSLPVVQLLFTYQQMVFQTGNQDLCYYNSLCAHPLGTLSDFNHVYSNLPYVLFGIAFMLHVRARQKRGHGARQDVGIPQHYGLLYSMGLALCMEGLLSACYHLCPNKMNFQFDSSFMYVIAVLVMLKLYQNRHSDLVPGAHATFLVLALVMTIGVCGILFPSVYFSVAFTLLYTTTCSVLTLKIYYAGRFKMEWVWSGAAWASLVGGGRAALRPAHRARAALLALANLANWSFAIYLCVARNRDVARQLVAVLLGNAVLYSVFYVAMKLAHGERLAGPAPLYAGAAAAAWAAAGHYFLHGNTRWAESPAESRRRNAECVLLRLFDSHDVWHVTSAAALYLSFHLLLVADDGLARRPRPLLATF